MFHTTFELGTLQNHGTFMLNNPRNVLIISITYYTQNYSLEHYVLTLYCYPKRRYTRRVKRVLLPKKLLYKRISCARYAWWKPCPVGTSVSLACSLVHSVKKANLVHSLAGSLAPLTLVPKNLGKKIPHQN